MKKLLFILFCCSISGIALADDPTPTATATSTATPTDTPTPTSTPVATATGTPVPTPTPVVVVYRRGGTVGLDESGKQIVDRINMNASANLTYSPLTQSEFYIGKSDFGLGNPIIDAGAFLYFFAPYLIPSEAPSRFVIARQDGTGGADLKVDLLTDFRNQFLPNKPGTFAMLDDIPGSGLTANFLPKSNGSGFVDSGISDVGGAITIDSGAKSVVIGDATVAANGTQITLDDDTKDIHIDCKGTLFFDRITDNGVLHTTASNGHVSVFDAAGLSAFIGLGYYPIIRAGTRYAAQTAAKATVATYTNGASDGSFEVSANVLVTTSTLHSFTATVSYTDEGNTARVVTMQFSTLAGAFVTAMTNAQGAVPYEGVPLHIRVKASTAITIGTTGTFTTVTYNVEGLIKQTL